MVEIISIEKKVLSENDRIAAQNRELLKSLGIVSLNLVSSPGSGKTSLLERTLAALQNRIAIGVIAGDVQTENDAQRLIRAGGSRVRPIITGGACHLDARMISRVLTEMDLHSVQLLFFENVGNLVCPSSYDLGEDMKIVLISTAEGDDKPLKYPAMFRRANTMVINKTDLLGTSDFDLQRAMSNALSINPELRVFSLSCRSGDGIDKWLHWLEQLVKH